MRGPLGFPLSGSGDRDGIRHLGVRAAIGLRVVVVGRSWRNRGLRGIAGLAEDGTLGSGVKTQVSPVVLVGVGGKDRMRGGAGKGLRGGTSGMRPAELRQGVLGRVGFYHWFPGRISRERRMSGRRGRLSVFLHGWVSLGFMMPPVVHVVCGRRKGMWWVQWRLWRGRMMFWGRPGEGV